MKQLIIGIFMLVSVTAGASEIHCAAPYSQDAVMMFHANVDANGNIVNPVEFFFSDHNGFNLRHAENVAKVDLKAGQLISISFEGTEGSTKIEARYDHVHDFYSGRITTVTEKDSSDRIISCTWN
jgi:hypothetical protein